MKSSMMETVTGDILKAEADALVNTVNCVGVMGRGIALQFKKKFPENFKAYKKACDAKTLRPGMMHVCEVDPLYKPRYVINFPTKDHWRAKSKIEDIRSGLSALVDEVKSRGIKSIAIPPLGCGLGGLNWNVVKPLIETAFENIEGVHVLLYEPKGAPPVKEMAVSKIIPKMTAGRAALIGLMRQYLSAVMDPFVSLLELHKLMYFMQAFDEPLKLRFKKAPYGPYAKNLRQVLIQMEGHYISGFGDGEDNPEKPIELCENSVSEAQAFLDQHPATQERFGKVADLINGFETPYGMELLATVHWVAANENPADVDEAIKQVHGWNERKKSFSPEHIRLAWQTLSDRNLVPELS